ncbi:unnamed protein product [Bathycoccus prasinos]
MSVSSRTTEVIVLTRSNGTVLATLDENKVGDWDLQHDEGTGYGSYTYNIRLDGVIKSTFSRDYQPNVPSFTTNFFSNSAKTISCGVENITNPSGLFTVQLARIDGAVLDSHVLNDATSFFLQFTELDYGTYDYQVLYQMDDNSTSTRISPRKYWVDTVIATHQHIFVRPEPTFTTSWTKSGLTINADLSSIVGAHPDFYAYLCRDDGTTLATHQFTEGQTTASLSFTEAEYGTFTYQLKLGTTVVSTHTETYVRPTPTYTASFSTNELTLTASITSITNAHNSFAITLERDDGTVLQTHTLADGETSFTFTQTETSYATFNYVVKINGTQTDTYSATYTPPPTPTFDIALTNDDLAITATLTNIVNPDPYYTFMIHDANDTHLDGHTFATGDTTVVLTWTETSYGEKTYTKLLNGASIGTETITLTDPNTSFTFPEVGTFIYFDEATWGTNFRLKLLYADVGGYDQYAYYRHDPQTTYTANGIQVERSTGIWSDWGNEAPNTVNNDTPTTGKIQFENQYNQVYTFTNPYPTSTPPPDIQPIVNTGGSWNGVHSWATPTTETINGSVEYHYKLTFDTNSRIAYRTIDKTWYDADTSSQPTALSSDAFSTQSLALVNPQYVWIGDTSATNTDFYLSFDNPYYETPSTPTPPTPEATIYPTSGAWNNQHYFVYRGDIVENGTTYFHYSLDFQPGNTITGYSILYDYTNKIWKDGDSAAPFYLHSSVPLVGTSFTITNPAHLHGFDTNSTEYFGFPNPYYEA